MNLPLRQRLPRAVRRLPSRRGILLLFLLLWTIGGAARPGSMPHAVYAQDPQPSPERPVTTPSPVLTTTQTISSTATSSPTSTVSPSPTPTMTPSVT
ncbi:MAG: hypothetical protein KDD84_04770, partial [Caldilineaceae bacterium]|nr:hypothetical protein [Caldilineaceae bacterium]